MNARYGRLTRQLREGAARSGMSVGRRGLWSGAYLWTLGESMWLRELDGKYEHRPEVMLQSGKGWYTEPSYRFDVGFVEDRAH